MNDTEEQTGTEKYFRLNELYKIRVTGYPATSVKLYNWEGVPIPKKKKMFMHYSGNEMAFWVGIPGGLDNEDRSVMFKVDNLGSVHTQRVFREHMIRFALKDNRVVMEFCKGLRPVAWIENKAKKGVAR